MEEVKERDSNRQSVQRKIKETFNEAFMFISEALALEERGKATEAVLCYEKGLRLVGTALSLRTDGLNDKELENAEKMKNKLEKAKVDVEYRLRVLKPVTSGDTMPSAPPLSGSLSNGARHEEVQWEDARTLISIEEGVRLFHVDSQRSVSTWSLPCSLKIFQLLGKDDKDENEPPAFMQCGDWMYPLHPGKSPALKSYHRTYMFPDLSLPYENGVPASVGVVLADASEKDLARFERILSCYCDFRKYSPSDNAKGKPPRPPPPYQAYELKETNTQQVAISGREIVPISHGQLAEMSSEDEEERSWSEKVSNGILIGAKWVSWGLSKGAELSSHYVEKGATKLRERMKVNAEPAKVDPEVMKNVQQIKEVTGAAVQVSTFLVSTLCSLTIQLGKQLSPVIKSQGSKLIPDKYKNGDESGQKRMDELIKVAAASVRGFGTVFSSLEESGKVLYKSITKATVDTVNHKYGDEASDLTGEAMAAAGNTAQAYWNVKKFGAKAVAKRAAKDTSKAVLMDQDERIKSKETKAIEYK